MNRTLLICLFVLSGIIIAKVVFGLPWGSIFYFSALAACPLLHVFMMKHGMHDHKDHKK